MSGDDGLSAETLQSAVNGGPEDPMAEWLSHPHNFWAALMTCHIYEQELQAKGEGAFYTPEVAAQFSAEQTIKPNLLSQLNEVEGTEYESIDEVFGRD